MPLIENEVKTYDCSVRVCQPCVRLEGQECHTPDCVFFLRSMAEVKHYLDVMLLCPVIRNQDGMETERIVLVPSEAPTPANEVNQVVTTMRQQASRWRTNVCLVPPTQYSVADVYEECAELILKCFNVEQEKQDLGR